MVALDDNYKSRAIFHLCGTQAGVPAGDLARIYEAVNNIPDDVTKDYIEQQIRRCDRAFTDINNVANTLTMTAETYAGDINRTVLRAQRNLEVVKYFYEIYYREVDSLARSLWCPEFRTPESDYYRYARSGGEYINSIPGSKGDQGDVVFTALQYS